MTKGGTTYDLTYIRPPKKEKVAKAANEVKPKPSPGPKAPPPPPTPPGPKPPVTENDAKTLINGTTNAYLHIFEELYPKINIINSSIAGVTRYKPDSASTFLKNNLEIMKKDFMILKSYINLSINSNFATTIYQNLIIFLDIKKIEPIVNLLDSITDTDDHNSKKNIPTILIKLILLLGNIKDELDELKNNTLPSLFTAANINLKRIEDNINWPNSDSDIQDIAKDYMKTIILYYMYIKKDYNTVIELYEIYKTIDPIDTKKIKTFRSKLPDIKKAAAEILNLEGKTIEDYLKSTIIGTKSLNSKTFDDEYYNIVNNNYRNITIIDNINILEALLSYSKNKNKGNATNLITEVGIIIKELRKYYPKTTGGKRKYTRRKIAAPKKKPTSKPTFTKLY